MFRIEIETKIERRREQVCHELLSMNGVNYELRPIARMTAPKEWEESSITEWPIGTNLFTSAILLFGLIPVDFHKFKFLDIQTTSFQECSTNNGVITAV